MEDRTCGVDGCQKPPRSPKAELCKMHYHRRYRHGDVAKVATRLRPTGYVRSYQAVYRPGHPLSGSNGKVYAHRLALYEQIGPGWHPCHWCSTPVTWDATRGEPTALVADHINAIGDDNRPENLVASCWGCNTTRGTQNRHRALVADGFWAANDTVGRLKRGRRPAIEVQEVA